MDSYSVCVSVCGIFSPAAPYIQIHTHSGGARELERDWGEGGQGREREKERVITWLFENNALRS